MADDRPAHDPLDVTVQMGGDAEWLHGSITVGIEGLHVLLGDRAIELSNAQIAGVNHADHVVTLHVANGEIISLRDGDDMKALAAALEAHICSMPEVTRGLRTFGTRKCGAGPEHDNFFAPLMEARVRAANREDMTSRMAAFAAPQLRAAMDAAVVDLARSRYPAHAPERRSLEETLRELLEPLDAALVNLGRTADIARAATAESRFSAWRSWCQALGLLFAAADRAWLAMSAVLDASPRIRPSLWQRLFRITTLLVVAPEILSQHVATADRWL